MSRRIVVQAAKVAAALGAVDVIYRTAPASVPFSRADVRQRLGVVA